MSCCICIFQNSIYYRLCPNPLKKLEYIGVKGTTLYLRKQRVKMGECFGDDADLTYGVPQGSVLGLCS